MTTAVTSTTGARDRGFQYRVSLDDSGVGLAFGRNSCARSKESAVKKPAAPMNTAGDVTTACSARNTPKARQASNAANAASQLRNEDLVIHVRNGPRPRR